MNGWLRFALGLANVPDKDVADLEKALPGMARLADLAKEAQPQLIAAAPHVAALEPIFEKLWPIVLKAMPDIATSMPMIEEFIQLAQSKGS